MKNTKSETCIEINTQIHYESYDVTQTYDNCIDFSPGTSTKNCCNYINKSLKLKNMSEDPGKNDISSNDSFEFIVCRICHNNENAEKIVSPCLCKGSLGNVHMYCLEKWIRMSRCTTCELCQFEYATEQNLRYTLLQSLRIWYSRSISRRALQEDCQMFSFLTLVAFGIVGTLLIAVQYYISQGNISELGRMWTKGWLIFFLFSTLFVYIINVYIIIKSHLAPWYRWWQSVRDIRLILENYNAPKLNMKQLKNVEYSKSSHITTNVENPYSQC
ncbi:E3 ubiquitin-protein ligase MARCHF2 [Cochliomyia hominivorax]